MSGSQGYLVIPTSAVPSQTLETSLAGQNCTINIYTRYSYDAAEAASGAAVVTGNMYSFYSEFTGSIAGNVLTVTAIGLTPVFTGVAIIAAGVAVGTTITAQLSGTPNGVGTYTLNIGAQTVPSTAMAQSYGILTVTAVASGTVQTGQIVSGPGVGGGVTIVGSDGGSGGAGSYVVVPAQTLPATSGLTCEFVTATLNQQPQLYLNLYVDNALVLGGAICECGVPLVQNEYLGFDGDLAFYDLQGTSDPQYGGLGDRWFLAYLPVGYESTL